ncbi:apoptosis-resistant E3 ubiquitin protein ligase 1 isoform X7 [Alligator sinensis]|uniref:Apoptosis-resistant E3 ubiquitin protein ligase 1 n=1 Tax=Alligator sinensis TaxID=38654 RepID=A0A3Q0GAX3_ALLSI|nr:apoptosis-resistant E3 ubiquitin protein ligase 1 isoform X7 [Alligator sinensis]
MLRSVYARKHHCIGLGLFSVLDAAVIFGCVSHRRDLMFYIIGGITVSVVAFFFTIKFLFELAARVVSFLQHEDRERRGERTIYDYVRGNYLDPRSCKVSWDWKDPFEVGHSMAFRVHLFYKNGQPFPAHRPVGLRVHICHVELAIDIPVTQEVLQEPSSNVVKVAFTVRRAGRYEITIKLGGLNVAYSPYYKLFQPGMVVPSKTKIVCHFSTLVLTCGQKHTLQIVPRDEYDNPTSNSVSLIDEHNYSLSIHELGPQEEESSDVLFEKSVMSNRQTCQVFLRLTLHRRGCFHACISYQNQPISNGDFDIIVLSENEKNIVERNVSTSGVSIYFEAYLYNATSYTNTQWHLPPTHLGSSQRRPSTATEDEDEDSPSDSQTPEKVKKPKKVYCYVSPKSLKATRNFSVSDWSKNFEVIFQDEEALDWGGPRREWFELICKALFDTTNQLFTRFSDNNQALVHPNPGRSPHLRLKVYEFAGRLVGKCLYESSLGGAYKQLVRARFTRSFLAQIIGLRMHYKYFETDDPEFYKSKVCFILNNDVSEMELVFAEEKYSKSGQLEKVVELVTGGAQIPVTNDNKILYLNLLAQYRLANQVREEVDHFLKGLNELVPENLLAIFDENELELLMCGTGDINVCDFKTHAVVVGGSWHFREKVMRWFWTVVSSFTQEELARLLQFTTGSSQLPPGGFAALCPSFQIIAAPTHSTLPTAHTCFNQLCLPTYDSYEEMHKMLQLAISEGCEGFGML